MNISFMLTKNQFRDRSKTVTRRLGWKNAKAGQMLYGCEKCQGLKRGEHVVIMGSIVLLHVRREPLDAMLDQSTEGLLYGVTECTKEGFPNMTAQEFVAMFCLHNKCFPSDVITRLQFDYI